MTMYILLMLLSCILSVKGETLIVGGEKEPNIARIPYLVSIHLSDGSRCGGSIISKRHVLTAAHCLEKKIAYVRSGSAYYEKGGIVTKTGRKVVNDDGGDLGILWVKTPFSFDSNTQPITLVSSSTRVPVNSEVQVAGWGFVAENSDFPDILQKVNIPVIPLSKCKAAYKEFPVDQPNSGNICAGKEEGGKDACGGDSGGPMVYKKQQAGIVSFGVGCARKEFPGVYVSVAYYRDWIRETSGV